MATRDDDASHSRNIWSVQFAIVDTTSTLYIAYRKLS